MLNKTRFVYLAVQCGRYGSEILPAGYIFQNYDLQFAVIGTRVGGYSKIVSVHRSVGNGN